jgi:pyruvate/2-oxoglutarate dehydrogenase complex dihydrolipoamide dehydrogenase (E3) component
MIGATGPNSGVVFMKNYDVIVIGSGCGAIISDEAVSRGLKVALVDKGPLIGGTLSQLGLHPFQNADTRCG